MKRIILIILLTLLVSGCCNCPPIIQETKTVRDTVFIPKVNYDTVKIEGAAKIIDIDTSKLIHPYTALIDSLFNVNDKLKVKLKASYSIKDNQFKIDVEQEKKDSNSVITQIEYKTNTVIEYVNRLEWYMYPIIFILIIIAFVIGFFISKFVK